MREQESRTTRKKNLVWRKADLHIHTPASRLCYAQPDVTYLQILQKAEER